MSGTPSNTTGTPVGIARTRFSYVSRNAARFRTGRGPAPDRATGPRSGPVGSPPPARRPYRPPPPPRPGRLGGPGALGADPAERTAVDERRRVQHPPEVQPQTGGRAEAA